VVVAAFLVYRTARFESITVDAFFSMVFVANWHFARVGSDYLASAGPVSPVQHFWSLGVEEQFYLLWPVVLVVILGAITRRRSSGRPTRTMLAVMLAAGVTASFVWALSETANLPSLAYFSTLSRGWEIAAGALLAVLADRLAVMPSAPRAWLSLGGLGLIAAGLFLITPASAVPAPGSAAPVVGVLLILAAGIGGQPRLPWVLTNPGAVYVGRISYSLYLWHFPVIVLFAVLLPAGPISLVATVIVVIAVSIVSFQLVEERFRVGARVSEDSWRRRPRVVAARVLVVACVMATSVVVAANAGTAGPQTSAPPAGADPSAQLSADIDAALQAEAWPDLTPAIDGIGETGRPPKDRECAVGLADPEAPSDHLSCAFGNPEATRLAVVAGDSIGITWIPMARELLEPRGYRVQGLTMSGCPFVGTDTFNPAANISAFCPDHKAAVLDAIRELQPDIVLVSNTYRPFLKDLPDVDTGAVRYAGGQRSIIEQIAPSTAAIYVLAPPPPGRAP